MLLEQGIYTVKQVVVQAGSTSLPAGLTNIKVEPSAATQQKHLVHPPHPLAFTSNKTVNHAPTTTEVSGYPAQHVTPYQQVEAQNAMDPVPQQCMRDAKLRHDRLPMLRIADGGGSSSRETSPHRRVGMKSDAVFFHAPLVQEHTPTVNMEYRTSPGVLFVWLCFVFTFTVSTRCTGVVEQFPAAF